MKFEFINENTVLTKKKKKKENNNNNDYKVYVDKDI